MDMAFMKIRNMLYFYIIGRNKVKNKGSNNHIIRENSCIIKDTFISMQGNNNTIRFDEGCVIRGLRVHVVGDNNTIEIGKKALINARTLQIEEIGVADGTTISMQGNNNAIKFDEESVIRGLRGSMVGDNNTIEIGKRVLINAYIVRPTIIGTADGASVHIGDDSLFSDNIEIHATDYHGIFNSKGQRINHEKDIYIGKNVWVGLGSKILKGTKIADGCVVGAGSVLSGTYSKENVILAGNTARIIKEQIVWTGPRFDYFEIPPDLKEKWSGKL